MKRFYKSIIAGLFFSLFIIPPAYAIENSNDKNPSLRLFPDTEQKQAYLIDGNKNDRSPVTLRSYITTQNAPESIINDITIDFSSRKSNKSFSMDFPTKVSDAVVIGSAFMTNLMMHEFGHAIIAGQVGASGNSLGFFKQQNGQFFLGTSSVTHIKSESRLPYVMGGEFFADLTFEQALKEYRKSPSAYNKSLLLFSGSDFLFYCLYAFSMDSENTSYDPVTISRETGLSQGALISLALTKTVLNAYRIHSGEDRIVPYFTVDNNSAAINFAIPF